MESVMPTDIDADFTTINHPLEDVFDIESNTTEIIPMNTSATELVVSEEFDEKDREIDGQFQEVYDAAIAAYDQQAMDAEVIEPKYRARNQEVAVQYLTAALNAAKEKSSMKAHKDKTSIDRKKASTPGSLTQNLIVDRNDILRALQKK